MHELCDKSWLTIIVIFCVVQGELRISVLPTHLTYDAPWPIRKVPLRCTPHFIVYHSDSKVCYCHRFTIMENTGAWKQCRFSYVESNTIITHHVWKSPFFKHLSVVTGLAVLLFKTDTCKSIPTHPPFSIWWVLIWIVELSII